GTGTEQIHRASGAFRRIAVTLRRLPCGTGTRRVRRVHSCYTGREDRTAGPYPRRCQRTGSRSAHPGNNCARCTRVLSVTVGPRLVVMGATGVVVGYAV